MADEAVVEIGLSYLSLVKTALRDLSDLGEEAVEGRHLQCVEV
jgi:hypothetical protein